MVVMCCLINYRNNFQPISSWHGVVTKEWKSIGDQVKLESSPMIQRILIFVENLSTKIDLLKLYMPDDTNSILQGKNIINNLSIHMTSVGWILKSIRHFQQQNPFKESFPSSGNALLHLWALPCAFFGHIYEYQLLWSYDNVPTFLGMCVNHGL